MERFPFLFQVNRCCRQVLGGQEGRKCRPHTVPHSLGNHSPTAAASRIGDIVTLVDRHFADEFQKAHT